MEKRVNVDRLKPGVFVARLDRPWLETPFLLQGFLVRSWDDVEQLKGSHGTERKHRAPGSISSFASDAGHGGGVKKGKRMAGHMGHTTVTTRNHKLVSIDEKKDLLVVKGAIAGPSGGYVVVRSSKRT